MCFQISCCEVYCQSVADVNSFFSSLYCYVSLSVLKISFVGPPFFGDGGWGGSIPLVNGSGFTTIKQSCYRGDFCCLNFVSNVTDPLFTGITFINFKVADHRHSL